MKLILDTNKIVGLTAVPELYRQAPFLAPMQLSAKRFHMQVDRLRKKKRCSGCLKRKLDSAMNRIAGTVADLTTRAARLDPKAVAEFKVWLSAAFKMPQTAQTVELRFRRNRKRTTVSF